MNPQAHPESDHFQAGIRNGWWDKKGRLILKTPTRYTMVVTENAVLWDDFTFRAAFRGGGE